MPAAFNYPDGADIWTPAELWPLGESRTAHNWRRLKAQHGDDSWMADAAVDQLHDVLVRDARPALFVLLASVVLLFAVAVANTANLVLARAIRDVGGVSRAARP
jgi:hypothetical protein